MLIRVEISFRQKFLERAKKEGILPHTEIREKLDELGEIQKLEIDQKVCKILLETEKKEKEIRHIVEDTIAQMEAEKNDVRIVIGKYEPLNEIQKEIDHLSGAVEFKELTQELVGIADRIKKMNLMKIYFAQNYLFAVNDGCGLSTYLRLLWRLLEALGLFEKGMGVTELKLEAPSSILDTAPLNACAEAIKESKKGIISIDISDWIANVTELRFKRLLRQMNQWQEDYIFVFRVPFLERNILERVRKGLMDLMVIRQISIVPFSQEDYKKYLDEQVKQYGFEMAQDSWPVIDEKINEEKKDGYFYGFNTIQKIMNEVIYTKAKNCFLTNADNKVIQSADIIEILPDRIGQFEKTGEEMLDELDGLYEVKRKVREIIALAENWKYCKEHGKELEYPCMHMKFLGNPGTGKTSIARIVGKIFYEKGILNKGSFIEISGRELCGRYIGETAPKTMAVCRDAYGSVLFIDEAYALYQGEGEHGDYGKEALLTLMTEMENHRDNLVVIFAGYSEEIEKMLEANPGLRDRIPHTVHFPNYAREELFSIFMKMVQKDFEYGKRFEEKARSFFMGIPDKIYQDKKFGNVRMVRNLYERVWNNALTRQQFSAKKEWKVSEKDLETAIHDEEFRKYRAYRN
ncbi:MAG: AAA family ATPase [Lachnospiraceae bacterium]|nr:AAA family ATPase [Robinsoniella sp.]MDY3765887.1 AAA family ATPase [Lachnospiraceae bacterium]